MSKSDDLMGVLYELSEQPSSKLFEMPCSDLNESLKKIVLCCIPTLQVPEDLQHEELVNWITDLRNNARSWGQALGNVIVVAHQHFDAGDKDKAMQKLQDFCAQCPWLPFNQVAVNQIASYR